MKLERLPHLFGAVRTFGLRGTAKVLTCRRLRRSAPLRLTARNQSRTFELLLRPVDSDLFVAVQVFGSNDYGINPERTAALNELARSWVLKGTTPVIVDAGANVGYSSLFFAKTYPEAVVLALEPEPSAFEVLCENTRKQSRIHPFRMALWSNDRGVNLRSGASGSWSTQVSAGSGDGFVSSRTLAQMVATVPDGQLLIAKIDIEGAEREACGVSVELLRSTPCIMIEPHDYLIPGSACLRPLYEATMGADFDTLLRGENLILIQSHLR